MSDRTNLGTEDLDALSIVERVGSVLSLLGCLFIIVTFCLSKAFHKPINRLVFYASFGNGITNIGTLMARTYIGSPDSAGCQTQAFLIQMFMPADAFWTLAMAINVYLTFYYKFDGERLRRMEIPYILVCYGIPLVPAMTYIFIRDSSGNRVYGDATLWCWVSQEWNIWRIITFYGPVWIVILVTFFIYIRTGGDIYRKRKQLRDFSSHDPDGTMTSNHFATIKTTEVSVTSEVLEQPPGAIGLSQMPRRDSATSSAGPRAPNGAYSVTITANPYENSSLESKVGDIPPADDLPSDNPATRRGAAAGPGVTARRRNYEVNNAAWSYAKCALLFFTALLITWIPSSSNRVYSVVNPGQSVRALEYMSAFVLPLQGFWNALIYVVTSWKACKEFFSDVWHLRRSSGVKELVGFRHGPGTGGASDAFKIPGTSRSANKTYETESMTELAHDSRPGSGDQQRLR